MKLIKYSLLVLSISLINGVNAQQTCFSSANNNVFEGIGNGRCITKGDFDNDGDLDVVMGNYTGTPDPTLQRLYFVENDGNASFSAPVSLESGSQPLDVQSADLNNDGNLDLVVVNFNLQRMAVMLGNGDGTFQSPVEYASDFGPNKITLKDFDGDGFVDVAITTNANTVNVFMNDNGTPGTFLPFTSFPLSGGSNPSGVFSGDVDKDGNMDIVTANNGTGNASVLIGDGTGDFSAATDYLTGVGCSSIVLGDMNNDTYLDIITSNEDDNEISILLNDQSGSFSAATNYSVGSGPIALMVDDFDNNLNLDVVTVNTQDNTLSVLLGNGNGTVQPQNVVGAINSPRNLITGDFNNDAHSDIIISCLVGEVMPVYLGDGNANFSSGVNSFAVGNEPVSLYSADFDMDGFEDFVSVNNLDNTATVHDGDGSGTNFVLNETLNTGNNPTSVIGADLNSNGFEDLIVTNYDDNDISVYMNSSGTFGAPSNYNANTSPIQVKTGDINFDGNPDIIILNEGNEFSVLIGDGSGGFSAPTTYATGNAPLGIDVGDIDNDNFDDVVVANSNDNNIGIYTNDGTGLFGAPVNRNVGTEPNSVTFGDLNGDGAPEIVTTNYGSNNISVSQNNGSGTFGFASQISTSNDTGPVSSVIEDFDGDGNNDVAVANLVSSASTGNVAIFVGDGTNTIDFDQSYAVGMDPRQVITNDFNSDGLPDLATVNNVSDNITVLLNTGGAPTITASGPTTFCGGDSVILESTPAPSYLWSNGETTQSITVTSSGTYDVSTSSGIGGWCSSISNQIVVDVTSGPALSFTGDTEICEGESTTLVVSGASTYTWSDGLGTGDTKSVSPTTTTTYTVTGDDGSSCTTDLEITIVVNPLPDASFSGLNSQYCETSSAAVLSPTTTGGTFSGPGVSSNQFDPVSAGVGTHIVEYTVTDANSCTNSSNQSVDVVSSTVDSDFSGFSFSNCINDATSTLNPNETGGTFSGAGVSGNEFNPSVAGIGSHVITHEITSGGCTSSTNYTIDVFELPDASFSGLDASYCSDAAVATLTPTETGGTFSGPGISGSDFNPSTAGTGNHTITYEITDGNGCTNSSNETVEVFALPDANFTGLDATYCEDAASVSLTPTVAGGTFSGPGVSGSDFNPSTAGTGNHTITYEITDGNGCTNSSNETVEVFALPDADFTGLATEYCISASSVTLSPNQGGGSFTGPGISGNDFDPASAGIGVHSITYSITDGNGCINSSDQTVEVYDLPDATFTGLDPTYCIDAAIVTLSPSQTGGSFSGPGMSGNDFDPNAAGAGIHTITYTITDGSGCVNSSNQTVEVDDQYPDATFSGLDPTYCANAASVTLTPTDGSGTFSGPGIAGSNFDPSTAGVGNHTITYSIVGANGCESIENQTVEILALPDATFTGLDATYCENAASATLAPTVTGGTFSGPGLSGSDFDPSTAGVGNHTITYDITDGNGCSNSSNETVEIFELPDADFTGLDALYCSDGALVTLTPNQVGGTFSGPGITGDDFDPSTAGVGIHTITYSITDGNGCVNSSNQIVEVDNTTLDADFTGLDPEYCSNDVAVTLIPNESGGTFSGNGVVGNDFDPSLAGTGTHIITYTITAGNGCTSSSNQTVEINAIPDANFTGLDPIYCINASTATLVPNETGGAFSGPGMSGDDFDAGTAGAGIHTVTYTITDGNGCVNSSNQTVEVDDQFPDADFTGLAPSYCADEPAVTLTPNETGGVFSGPGITGNDFDASTAGTGVHTINYNITNPSGCSSSSLQTVEVLALPDADFTGLDATYCLDGAVSTLTPNQTGGTFSGTGVVGNEFDPSLAGAGTHIITYSITDGNGCSSSVNYTTEVTPPGNATFTGLNSNYCLDDPSSTLVPAETGGTFSGPGISGNEFDPSLSGVGIHTVVYTITDGSGCSNSSNQVVEVGPLPSAEFTGLDVEYCKNDSPITLVPASSGGIFSGNGVSGNEFNPDIAGVGVHAVSYIVTDANGCSNISSQFVEVLAVPDASFTTLDEEYCIDAASVTLVPNETGGTFSGTGVVGNEFDPSVAGNGSHSITYSINNANGCSSEDSQTVDVDDQFPDATFTGLNTEYCENNEVVELVPNEAGGTFTGAGIDGNEFNPAAAGVGVHSIDYVITGANSCSSSSSQTVEVLEVLDATFTGLDPEYCLNDSPITLTPAVAGGTFSGPGVTSNTFDPNSAGVGTHIITYTQVNTNGCVSIDKQEVEVHEVLDATFSGLESSYCSNEMPDTLVPASTGGSFTGNLFGNVFNPDNAQSGSNTITYTIQTSQGCTSSSSQTADVFNAPSSLFSINGLTLNAFTSGPNITYQWFSCTGDSIITGATNQSYEVTENGSYALIVSNNQCTDTSKCEVIDYVGVSEYEEMSVVIYPNPTNGLFNIEIPSNSELKVYDAVGKLIHVTNLNSGFNVIDMKAKVETGVYLLEIVSESGIKSVHNLVVRQ